MSRSASLTLALSIVILVVAGISAGGEGRKKFAKVEGRPSVSSEAGPTDHLLDRGRIDGEAKVVRGGGPATPIPIAFPGAGPMDAASGFAAGVGAFGTGAGVGAFAGNLFAPGPGYPPGFLTGGATTGFLVTGVYAWHSPFLKTGPVTAVLAGSTRRILAAAAAAVPATPLALAAVGPTGFKVVTVSTGLPGPTGIVGGAGNLAGSPVMIGTGGFSAVFCGLAIGGPGFIDAGWLANGVGAVIPPGPMPMPPPTRLGYPPTIFGTTGGVPFPVSAVAFSATPQTQVAGCFAAGSTTPVELQSFHVD